MLIEITEELFNKVHGQLINKSTGSSTFLEVLNIVKELEATRTKAQQEMVELEPTPFLEATEPESQD